MSTISTEALRLLLGLLEGRSLRYSYATLHHYGAVGIDLINSGLLEPCGHQKATFADEDDGEPVAIVFDEHRDGYGYHSPSQGWVGVDLTRLGLYRPNIDKLTELTLGEDFIRPKLGALERVSQLAWEIGSAWLTKKAQTPVWLVRRLDDRGVVDQLAAELRARASPYLRLVLSTTPRFRLDRVTLPDAVVVAIEDVLSNSEPNRIDFYALRTRFSGTPDEEVSEPLHLSHDGRTLTILGRIEISFKSEIQVKIIRQLVDAYQAGKRLKASVILNKAGSKAGSLDQAFGKTKWKELSPYLSSLHGLWGFDV